MSTVRAEQPPTPKQPNPQQREPVVDLLGQRSPGWIGRRGQEAPTPESQKPSIPLSPEHEAFREIFDPI